MNQVLPRQRTPRRGRLPARDVRLVLVPHADRLAVERRVPAGREVEHELVAVVEKPAAVDWLVVPDREIVGEPRALPGQRLLDRDRLDPVNGVLQLEMRPRAACATSSAVHGSVGLAPDVQEERPVRRPGASRAADPSPVHCEILRARHRVVVTSDSGCPGCRAAR